MGRVKGTKTGWGRPDFQPVLKLPFLHQGLEEQRQIEEPHKAVPVGRGTPARAAEQHLRPNGRLSEQKLEEQTACPSSPALDLFPLAEPHWRSVGKESPEVSFPGYRVGRRTMHSESGDKQTVSCANTFCQSLDWWGRIKQRTGHNDYLSMIRVQSLWGETSR